MVNDAADAVGTAVNSLTKGKVPAAVAPIEDPKALTQGQLAEAWTAVINEIPELRDVRVATSDIPILLSALAIARPTPGSSSSDITPSLTPAEAVDSILRVGNALRTFATEVDGVSATLSRLNGQVATDVDSLRNSLSRKSDSLLGQLADISSKGTIGEADLATARQVENTIRLVSELGSVLNDGAVDSAKASILLQQVTPLLPPDLSETGKQIAAVLQNQGAIVDLAQNAIADPKSLLTGAVTNLADSVGIPVSPEFKALQAGLTGALTGNYVGAAMAVAGALGLMPAPGADPGAEARHQEVMSTLKRMDAKLDTLIDGQRKIQQAIATVSRQVAALDEKVTRNHLDVMTALARLDERVAVVTVLADKLVLQGFDRCESFLRATSFPEMRQLLESNPQVRLPQFEQCTSFIAAQDNQPNEFAGFWYASSSLPGFEKLKAVNHPAARYVQLLPVTRAKLLTNATSDAPTLLLTREFFPLAQPTDATGIRWTQIEQYYNTALVIRFADAALALARWWMLAPQGVADARLLEPSSFSTARHELLSQRKREVRADFLGPALAVVEQALLQQGLLSGQGFLAALADQSNDPEIAKAIATNRLLRENLARYTLARAARGLSQTRYNFLQQDLQALNEALCKGAACKVLPLSAASDSCLKGGCQAVFGEGDTTISVALPPPSEWHSWDERGAADGFWTASVTDDFRLLSQMQRRLLSALADYSDVPTSLTLERQTRALFLVTTESTTSGPVRGR